MENISVKENRSVTEILEMHQKWLVGNDGKRLRWYELSTEEKQMIEGADLEGANLRDADLEGADLEGAYLRIADLRGANLEGANLKGTDLRSADLRIADLGDADLRIADLRGANLEGANLKGTDLRSADLRIADLGDADLRGADLRSAYLEGANLRDADLRGADLRSAYLEGANLEGANGLHINCPEVGSFIAFKKLSDNLIAKLEIPEHAKRSSSTGRKCRASTAKVLEIFNIDNYEKKYEIGYSEHRADFKYEVGKFVFPDSFNEDRFNECSSGIHFFITLQEAIDY